MFDLFQGLYVFSVYFVMHNQFFWPAKATYTVEMNGHGSPDSMYQGAGSATVGGGEISKSTQNLISAMEEVGVLIQFPHYQVKISILPVSAEQCCTQKLTVALSNIECTINLSTELFTI